MNEDPSDEKIEYVAKAMCAAVGVDPRGIMKGSTLQNWVFYELDAIEAVLACMEFDREHARQ